MVGTQPAEGLPKVGDCLRMKLHQGSCTISCMIFKSLSVIHVCYIHIYTCLYIAYILHSQ